MRHEVACRAGKDSPDGAWITILRGLPEKGCYRMSQLVLREKDVTLLDLLDRILDKGILLNGDITISVADVDLIYLGLKVLLSSVDTVERMRTAAVQSLTQIEEK